MNKKKYSILLLVALFTLFLSLSTTSYAYISNDYIKYTFQVIGENLEVNHADKQIMKDSLIEISNNNQFITDISTRIRAIQDEYAISALQDVNLTCWFSSYSSGTIYLYFAFANNGANYGVEDLGFLEVRYGNSLRCNGLSTDKIYTFQLGYKVSTKTYTFQKKKILTPSVSSDLPYPYFLTITYNDDLSVVKIINCSASKLPSIYVSYPWSSNGILYPMSLLDANGNFAPIPDPDPEDPDPEDPDDPRNWWWFKC